MIFRKILSLSILIGLCMPSMQVAACGGSGLSVSEFLASSVYKVTKVAGGAAINGAGYLGKTAYKAGKAVGKKVISNDSPQYVRTSRAKSIRRSPYSNNKSRIYSEVRYKKSTPKTKKLDSNNYVYAGAKNLTEAQRIQKAINRASNKTGLPVSLISAMIKKESAFNPRAVSHSGARGLTQLMPATASWECKLAKHELFNIEKNVDCGTGYLAQQYKTFGRYDLALAAYNAGPGAVQRAIKKTRSRNIHKVTSVLKSETAPYVKKIMSDMHNYKG